MLKRDNRVGRIYLQQFSRPAFGIAQQALERLTILFLTILLQQSGSGRRRRTGARVEHRQRHFAPRKRAVEHRQVADDERQKTEADARFDDRQRAPCALMPYAIFCAAVRCGNNA